VIDALTYQRWRRKMRVSVSKKLILCLIVPVLCLVWLGLQSKAEAKCVTLGIGKKATADGSVIMAHEEDYGPSDCMHIVYHPRATHKKGEIIDFAFEDVPQVELTYAYTADEMYDPERLGLPPATFMNGINEWGVTASSNCFDTKEPLLPNDKGLGWPEMLQLVMERCKTAREGIELCTRLIDKYTFNGFEATSCKNLTFVIADPNEVWQMAVTNRHYVARRIADDAGLYYANELQIETEWDMASDDLIDYAVAEGWYDKSSGEPFNFKKVYGADLGQDWNVKRQERVRALLEPKLGSITVTDVMGVLRDHYDGTKDYNMPHSGNYTGAGGRVVSICNDANHAAHVYHLRGNMPTSIGSVMWICSGAPCCGVFTPIYAGHRGQPPEAWRTGGDSFDPDSAWWTFEQIQRVVTPMEPDPEFYNTYHPQVRARWDRVQGIEFSETVQLEKAAMKAWEEGKTDEAQKMLTDYANMRLRKNFWIAQGLLSWLYAMGGEPEDPVKIW